MRLHLYFCCASQFVARCKLSFLDSILCINVVASYDTSHLYTYCPRCSLEALALASLLAIGLLHPSSSMLVSTMSSEMDGYVGLAGSLSQGSLEGLCLKQRLPPQFCLEGYVGFGHFEMSLWMMGCPAKQVECQDHCVWECLAVTP